MDTVHRLMHEIERIQPLQKRAYKAFFSVLKILDSESCAAGGLRYEFSVHESLPVFKFLHLAGTELSILEYKRAFYKCRKKQIENVIDVLNTYGFALDRAAQLVRLIDASEFPMQIAFEFKGGEIDAFKLYFSNPLQHAIDSVEVKNLLRPILLFLGIKRLTVPQKLVDALSGLDSVGIDFPLQGSAQFKLYGYCKEQYPVKKIKQIFAFLRKLFPWFVFDQKQFIHDYVKLPLAYWGFLFRINRDGSVIGIKPWIKTKKVLCFVREKTYQLSYIGYLDTREYYFRWRNSRDLDVQKISREIYVLFLVLTTDCNFNCSYCFVKKSPRYMDEETARKGVTLLLKSPGKNKLLKLYGGEPLLHYALLKKIIPFAHTSARNLKKDLTMTVCTNMSLLTPQMLHFFKRYSVRLALSSDGRPESHDIHRLTLNGKASSKIVQKSFGALEAYYPQEKMAVNVTVPRSCVQELFCNVMYIFERGICTINIEPIMSLGWTEKEKKDFACEYEKILMFVVSELRQGRFYFITQVNRQLSNREIEDIVKGECLLKRDLQLTPEGELYANVMAVYAGHPGKVLGNIHNGIFTEHLYCLGHSMRVCRTCKDDYSKGISFSNNPVDVRAALTIRYAELIRTKAKKDVLYARYIRLAGRHICF